MSSPESGSLEIERSAGIATLTFAHPKANCLPLSLLAGLAEAITNAGREHDIRVVVLQSTGCGSFCGGASFDEFKRIATLEEGIEFFLGFARILLAIRACPRFVVARVQGKSVGGGVGILAASDYALAHSSAAIRLSEFELGLGPFTIGLAVERKIGASQFGMMSIDAEWRDAAWAQRHGIYAGVYPKHEVLDTVLREFVQKLAGRSELATKELKQMLWTGTEEWPQILPERARISAELLLAAK